MLSLSKREGASPQSPLPISDTLNTRIQETAVATSVRLDPALERRLDRLVAQTGRTKAYYLREMVAKGLDDLEDYYLAASTMERVRKGEEPILSAEAVRRSLSVHDASD
jgi:RHH-type rel operon transcriptional repressor/antitoxin RelB